MACFEVSLEVGTPQGDSFEAVQVLVDTGSFFTWLAPSLLARLGVVPSSRSPFQLADGRIVEKDMGETRVRLDGQERTTLVVFGNENAPALLGAYTLEGFGLAVDPVNQRLVPVPVFPAAAQLADGWASLTGSRRW